MTATLDAMTGRLISTSEAATAVGWSYASVYRLVDSGVIVPAVYSEGTGARWRWSPADVALLRVLRRAARVAPAEHTPFLRAVAARYRQHFADAPPRPGGFLAITPGRGERGAPRSVFVVHDCDDVLRLATAAGAAIVVALDDVA